MAFTVSVWNCKVPRDLQHICSSVTYLCTRSGRRRNQQCGLLSKWVRIFKRNQSPRPLTKQWACSWGFLNLGTWGAGRELRQLRCSNQRWLLELLLAHSSSWVTAKKGCVWHLAWDRANSDQQMGSPVLLTQCHLGSEGVEQRGERIRYAAEGLSGSPEPSNFGAPP